MHINFDKLQWEKDKFSTKDTRKNPNDVGIVYPIERTDTHDQPSYSCIIRHTTIHTDSETAYIAGHRYTLINDDGVDTEYSLEHCNTVVFRDSEDIKDTTQAMYKIGMDSKQVTYILSSHNNFKEGIEFTALEHLKFTPEFIIDPNNLSLEGRRDESQPQLCSGYRNYDVYPLTIRDLEDIYNSSKS